MAHYEVFDKLVGKQDAFKFGAVAELDGDTVNAYKMRPALRRFGKALAKQLKVPGIAFLRIEFHSILDLYKKKKNKTID